MVLWGGGESLKDFKPLNNNSGLHFREILKLWTDNCHLMRILPLIPVNQQMEILTKLHCPRE